MRSIQGKRVAAWGLDVLENLRTTCGCLPLLIDFLPSIYLNVFVRAYSGIQRQQRQQRHGTVQGERIKQIRKPERTGLTGCMHGKPKTHKKSQAAAIAGSKPRFLNQYAKASTKKDDRVNPERKGTYRISLMRLALGPRPQPEVSFGSSTPNLQARVRDGNPAN